MLACVTGSAPFVGRQRELAVLDQAWSRAVAGVGGLVVVRGGPGVGKSWLVEAFVERRRHEGHAVYSGQCWEAGGAPSYWPWTQALRLLVRSLGEARLHERLGRRLAFLQAVLPEEGQGTPSIGDEPQRARFQVFDAVGELLIEAALETPICIVLEDLHAADEESLLMLEFLARASPALIVGTYREREIAQGPHGPTMARVARRAASIDLAPLDQPATAELLAAAWGTAADPELVARIHQASEGNPLYLSELARHVKGSARRLEQLAIPAGIESAIAEHLRELDAPTRALLEAASVLGREVQIDRLARLVERRDDGVVRVLQAAMRAGLLQETGPGTVRFTHFMHRAVIHQGMPPAQRCALHLRAAELLLETTTQGEGPWSELAHHYYEAGYLGRDRVIEATTRAAHAATRRRAFSDAVALHRRARELSEQLGETGTSRHLELLLALGKAEIDAGMIEQGRATCDDAIAAARELRDAAALARGVLVRGSVFVLGVVDARLVGLLEEALGALGEHEVDLRAQMLARHAAALQPASNPEGPIALAREAIALARSSSNPRTLLVTLRYAVSAMMDLGRPAERLALNEEHVELAVALGEPNEALRGHLRLVMDALELPDLVRADDHLEAFSRLAEELGLARDQALAFGMRAVRANMEGRTVTAERWTEQMRSMVAHCRDPSLELTLALHELGALRSEGRHEAVLTRLDTLDVAAWPDRWGPATALALRASTLARLGRAEEGRSLLTPSDTRFLVANGDPMNLCFLGEVAAAAGDRTLALRVHQALEGRRGHCVSWGVLGSGWDGPVDRVLGLLECCLGRSEDAQRSFAAARDLCERLETPVHLEQVERDRGRMLGPTNDAPARPVPAPRPPVERLALRREGEAWLLEGRKPPLRFKDTRGMSMLARLLDEPGRELHVLDLSGSPRAVAGDAGPVLDDRARAEYRRRAEQLRTELAEAESWNDPVRAERARQELEMLSRELARAVGLGGRDRASRSSIERARVNVQRRIRDAVRRIGEHDEMLGRHLLRAVRTGTYCAYEPD